MTEPTRLRDLIDAGTYADQNALCSQLVATANLSEDDRSVGAVATTVGDEQSTSSTEEDEESQPLLPLDATNRRG